MINVEVVVESKLWKHKIKRPNSYLKKKIKKISKLNFFSKKKIFSFTVLLTSSSRMKNLNKKFRKKNKTTDVLSFPFYDFNKYNKRERKIYLGDIALCYEIINRRSKNSSFYSEFDKMWIHGYLHLMGYDHKKIKDYEKMRKVENKILTSCS